MNILPLEAQVAIIAHLVDGNSIRATERLTGIHRDTIMRLGVRVGQGCAMVHDRLMRNLRVSQLECDEIWSYVGKKQRRAAVDANPANGDQYIFVGMAATTKAVISYRVGKRDSDVCEEFCQDLRSRVLGQPEILTDGFTAYLPGIRRAFGGEANHGVIVKKAVGEPGREAWRKYSPGVVVAVDRTVVSGRRQRSISTSFVERGNLSMRMNSRRLTRLTNGFSKKLENHVAAISLYFCHYNLCRVHETLKTTPAMALGIADHVWTIGELVEAATAGVVPELAGRFVGGFRVIDGGKN